MNIFLLFWLSVISINFLSAMDLPVIDKSKTLLLCVKNQTKEDITLIRDVFQKPDTYERLGILAPDDEMTFYPAAQICQENLQKFLFQKIRFIYGKEFFAPYKDNPRMLPFYCSRNWAYLEAAFVKISGNLEAKITRVNGAENLIQANPIKKEFPLSISKPMAVRITVAGDSFESSQISLQELVQKIT
jgi:hypothetical protein